MDYQENEVQKAQDAADKIRRIIMDDYQEIEVQKAQDESDLRQQKIEAYIERNPERVLDLYIDEISYDQKRLFSVMEKLEDEIQEYVNDNFDKLTGE